MRKHSHSETYQIQSTHKKVSQVITRLAEFCLHNNIDKENIQEILVVTDEALTNIVLYSYPINSYGKITVTFTLEESNFIIECIHFGKPFKPLNMANQSTTNKFKIGGYGLKVMHSFMDHLDFHYDKDGCYNRLRMQKKIVLGAKQ